MKNEMSPEARKLKNEYSQQHRTMSPEARKLKNEYNRKWKRNNPEKIRQYQIEYWERRAAEAAEIAEYIITGVRKNTK